MARAPAVSPGVVLPDAPPKYDQTNEREARRLLEQAMRQLLDYGTLTSVPENITTVADLPDIDNVVEIANLTDIANLSALAGLTGAADKVPYFTGVAAMALASLTPYARTILACAAASNARTALGLGSLAVLSTVTESEITLADVTTLNVSTSKHGLVPKAPGSATQFLDGTGAFSTPAGGGPPPLGTFPSISGLKLRLSAELSTMTLNTDGLVAQINDLSGAWGSNFTAATLTRPRYSPAVEALGGRPGLFFDGNQNRITATGTKTVAQPCTVVTVFAGWRTPGGANQDMYRDSNLGPVFFRNGGSQWAIFAGTGLTSGPLYTQNIQSLPLLDYYAARAVSMQVYNGGSSILSNNGVEVTGAAGATGFSGTLCVGSNGGATFATMWLYEILIYDSALSPTDRAALNTYYANALRITL